MLFSKGLADLVGFYLQKKANQLISCWFLGCIHSCGFVPHVVFLIVFSSGFYGCGTGGSDATDMIMDHRDGGGGIMEGKRIKEWKRKSRMLTRDHGWGGGQ